MKCYCLANLTSQISNLQGQITNLTYVNLVTALGVTEVWASQNDPPPPVNHLYITGWVTNTGAGTAYNAGLHVVAYNSTGTLEINMTVPLVSSGNWSSWGATFGTDVATDNFISSAFGSPNSTQLGVLYSRENVTIEMGIFHEGIVLIGL